MSILDDVLLQPEVVDEPSGYLDSLIDQAQAIIIGYKICDLDGARLDEYPDEGDDPYLDALCVRLVTALYRRGGTEHATNVGMGDYSTTAADVPGEIDKMLKRRSAPAWDL